MRGSNFLPPTPWTSKLPSLAIILRMPLDTYDGCYPKNHQDRQKLDVNHQKVVKNNLSAMIWLLIPIT